MHARCPPPTARAQQADRARPGALEILRQHLFSGDHGGWGSGLGGIVTLKSCSTAELDQA